MEFSKLRSSINRDAKRMTGLFHEETMDQLEDALIPSAPVQSLDSFHLNKSSFDFTMTQVLTPRQTVFTSGDMHFEPCVSQQSKQYTSGGRRKVMDDKGGSYRIRPELSTPAALLLPDPEDGGKSNKLRSIEEIPFRHIFKFPYFNVVQSTVLDEVLYTDKSIVVCAPTGSGKTVVFEIALIRLLMKKDELFRGKIIYMAPMKALCTERFQDWQEKFEALKCMKVTGDSELDDVTYLKDVNLICTTPEKWDSMSRRWKDKKGFFHGIRLFLIDEIHSLNDATRGATIEAVVSRMKTLQTASSQGNRGNAIRFIAVSATLPNYTDIAEWLSTPSKPAAAYNIEEKYRPVKLERFVIGYPFKTGASDFRFDMNLSYRLRGIIDTYSHGKPTLVFCSSRKSVIQSAEILSKDVRMQTLSVNFSQAVLKQAAQTIHEQKVAELLFAGIGVHHAGLPVEDRQTIEELFRTSKLPVLISTSTLAMGVNLPAHLVIIKSTHFYNMGSVEEYSDMQLLQMIGRAGRPQFDTSATAVIMTKTIHKCRYESLVKGTQQIESSLHKNLIEHLNAEIVLETITDMSLAIEWMRQTFLYVRVLKNASYYGLPVGLSKGEVEKRLQDLCLKNLNLLTSLGLVSVEDESYNIIPKETGRLMARYCIAFETMKHFHKLGEHQESVADMLQVVSECAEFEDVQLRINEKRILNSLNKDKTKESIRFPLPGKIKNKPMKVNCLIQAQLSCLSVQDYSLSQDISKIFRVGQRVAKCLMELLYQKGDKYSLLLHAILVYKGLKTRLWFDSRLVSRQLDGIGPAMSLALAKAGLNSFQMLEQAHPRDIEVIVNRHPPFGNQIKESVSRLPRYELAIEQVTKHAPGKALLSVCVDLINRTILDDGLGGTVAGRVSSGSSHQALLLVGDEDNNVVFRWRILDSKMLSEGPWSRSIEVKRALSGPKLSISLLSLEWVGLDIQTEYIPVYSPGWTCPQGQGPASKLKGAMDKAKGVKGRSCNATKNCNATKRSQASSKMESVNLNKQAKLEPSGSAGNPNILSDILRDMGSADTLHIKQPRITLKKFAYEKPKSLSHGKERVNVFSSIREQMDSKTERQTPMLMHSSYGKNNSNGFEVKHPATVNQSGNGDDIWGDEDFTWEEDFDFFTGDDKVTTTIAGQNPVFQSKVDNNINMTFASLSSARKDSKSNKIQMTPIDSSLDSKQPCVKNFALERPSHNCDKHHTSSTPNCNPSPQRNNGMYHSTRQDNRLFEAHSATAMVNIQSSKNSHQAPATPCSNSVNSNLALNIHSADHLALSALSKIPASPNLVPYSSSLMPPQRVERSAVMGGDVDDFMRQQGYLEKGNSLLLTSVEEDKSEMDRTKLPPGSQSQSDDELYQFVEEHELHQSLLERDSFNNVSSGQKIDNFDCCEVVEVNSYDSSPLPSPCHSVTKPQYENNYHCKSRDNVNHPDCNNRHHNVETINETETPYHNKHRNYYDCTEISWSPSDSQLSQQISLSPVIAPVMDVGRQIMCKEGVRVTRPVLQRPMVVESNGDRPSPSAKSPHRFGLVQAWPRTGKPQCITATSITHESEPRVSEESKSCKSNGNSKHSRMASMFVPQHEQKSSSETYVPGKLFDGIFEGLL